MGCGASLAERPLEDIRFSAIDDKEDGRYRDAMARKQNAELESTSSLRNKSQSNAQKRNSRNDGEGGRPDVFAPRGCAKQESPHSRQSDYQPQYKIALLSA
eukprot:Hpha_TRINITY_DN16792_c3_g2::TRINITY_DN16792_c3_g2_i2::g.77325::m.77325